MYLNQLTLEQKQLFLDLCIHASRTDSQFDEKERSVIEAYCGEMQIPLKCFTAERTMDDVIEKISEISSPEIKRIISLELTALVLSDDIFNAFEREFMNKINEKLCITNALHNEMIEVINDLTLVYSRMQKLLTEQ